MFECKATELRRSDFKIKKTIKSQVLGNQSYQTSENGRLNPKDSQMIYYSNSWTQREPFMERCLFWYNHSEVIVMLQWNH